MADIIYCPHCHKARVFKYRLDSDWSAAGWWSPANPDEVYDKETFADDSMQGHPDIEIYCCLDCGHFWDGMKEDAQDAVHVEG